MTPADIRLNQKLCGPCIQCLEGKSRRKAMSPLDTPPATSVGMCIHFIRGLYDQKVITMAYVPSVVGEWGLTASL